MHGQDAAIMDRGPTRLGDEIDEDDLPGMFATPAEAQQGAARGRSCGQQGMHTDGPPIDPLR
jgi:hypothetical protein